MLEVESTCQRGRVCIPEVAKMSSRPEKLRYQHLVNQTTQNHYVWAAGESMRFLIYT